MDDDSTVWTSRYAHPCDWDAAFPPLSLPDMLAASVAQHADAPLIDFFGRKFSYATMMGCASRVASGLIGMGVERGDRVGLFLPNVPHYVSAYYGVLMAGATVVNFSPLYTADELKRQVEDSGTTILFTLDAQALLPKALKLLEGSGLKRLVVGSIASALPRARSLLYRTLKRSDWVAQPRDPRILPFLSLAADTANRAKPVIDPDTDIALLQYTGGTTGTPKGAILTHQNMTAVARQVQLMDSRRGEPGIDRIVGVLPLFHMFANSCILNRTIVNGGEIVMLPRFEVRQMLAAIRRTRATILPGVPTMFQALVDHPAAAKADLSSLRICISGGAPLSPETRRRFEALTAAPLVEGYGLTESSGVVSSNPYDGPWKPGTIGQPTAGTRVKLVDKGDPTRPAAPGEAGEIVVAGPQVMKGYWRDPQADAEMFVDGWLRTGDVGEIDADGYIRIVDRLKDMIMVGGFNVFPSRIEAALQAHPAVREALVIGVPYARQGERPKAFVTLQRGAAVDARALESWLNPRLGKHERVKTVEIRAALPKTTVGKLSRKELVAEEREKALAARKIEGAACASPS